jgi:hypothetical protein
MKKVMFTAPLRLLLFVLFLGTGNVAFALPAPSIVADSAPVHEIRSEQHLNREGVLFSFQQQTFEIAPYWSEMDPSHFHFWNLEKENVHLGADLNAFEIQYLLYSQRIRPSLDGLVLIFPFHTFL